MYPCGVPIFFAESRAEPFIRSTRPIPFVDGKSIPCGPDGPAFTESIFRITVSLMNPGEIITTPDFPPAPYVENIRVRPDIPVDYMTRANLMSGGASFVQAFIAAVENLVKAN